MDRATALGLLKQHVKSESLTGHCISTAAVMKGLAKELNEDENLWETIGILHDIDFEEINEDMQKHGLVGYEILKEAGVDEEIASVVKRHNHMIFGSKYTTNVEIALQASDSVSGLVIACAYVKGRKISEVTPKTVSKKYKTASFAAGCDRERIALGDKLVERNKLFEIAINEIAAVKNELGLE